MTSLTKFRIAYNDCNSSFSELLEMANESTIDVRNLKFIVTEIFRLLNGLIFPPIIKEVFQINDYLYGLRRSKNTSI